MVPGAQWRASWECCQPSRKPDRDWGWMISMARDCPVTPSSVKLIRSIKSYP